MLVRQSAETQILCKYRCCVPQKMSISVQRVAHLALCGILLFHMIHPKEREENGRKKKKKGKQNSIRPLVTTSNFSHFGLVRNLPRSNILQVCMLCTPIAFISTGMWLYWRISFSIVSSHPPHPTPPPATHTHTTTATKTNMPPFQRKKETRKKCNIRPY